MTMNKPQAIIFDMDGLLVDSETVWEEAENALVAARGHEQGFSQAIREQVMGMRMDVFLPKLRELFQLEDSVENLYTELIGNMLGLIPERALPMPGALELLDYIVENQIPCAIASGSPAEIIECVVIHRGWAEIFITRISADTVPNGKPAPDVFLEAARQLGVPASACLVLEDSPNGARAAAAAGMRCFAVADRRHTRVEAFGGITDYVFDSLHDVLAALKKL
jgi:HAD superfamily hydrolase (TIGR01509 family)